MKKEQIEEMEFCIKLENESVWFTGSDEEVNDNFSCNDDYKDFNFVLYGKNESEDMIEYGRMNVKMFRYFDAFLIDETGEGDEIGTKLYDDQGYSILEKPLFPGIAIIHDLYINKKLRGIGLGEKMLRHFCSDYAAMAGMVYLNAHPFKEESGDMYEDPNYKKEQRSLIKFYLACGFKHCGIKGSTLMYLKTDALEREADIMSQAIFDELNEA